MNHRRSLIGGLIGLLLVTHAGCNRVSRPAASADVTDAQLAAFNEAMLAPAADLMAVDVKNTFAEAVKQSFGPDKTSLVEARRVRDQTLESLNSSIENLEAAPTPYVPEAWALKQACMSFCGVMRDISTVYFDEMIELAQDDSLSVEEKTDIASQAFLRSRKLVESALQLQEQAEAAWQAWLKARPSTN